MTNLNDMIAAEVLSRFGGSGDITIENHTRANGSAFIIAKREGFFWTAPSVEDLPRVMIDSIIQSAMPTRSQEEIAEQIGIDARVDWDMKQWTAANGKKGGSVTSDAKKRAASENGKKGGRPKKQS